MSKIYPSTGSSSCTYGSSERETYTVWMKSLVFHGNGCTVFDSKGDVVYRVDNYQTTCGSEVFLMDSSGRVLFSVKRKKFWFFWCREGFKWNGNGKVNKGRPWFQVRSNGAIWRKGVSCRVALAHNENTGNAGYVIEGLEEKSALKIKDFSGQLLAEAAPKKSSDGVPLGEDVLKLMLEPNADRSLIMSLVTVYGLIKKKI